ncbi:hypothetical protein LCGC14_1727520 [marine sediment metagenome]|uniref:Uncharacterized protein n=1 Tax=marine sediment metagenome TaxID=412755 RepID=A0A0F9HAK5_9ZZZZ
MALTTKEQEEVDRALVLLDGLDDDDKREVVRMAYAAGRGELEACIAEKRVRLADIRARRRKIDAMAAVVGIDLDPPNEGATGAAE